MQIFADFLKDMLSLTKCSYHNTVLRIKIRTHICTQLYLQFGNLLSTRLARHLTVWKERCVADIESEGGSGWVCVCQYPRQQVPSRKVGMSLEISTGKQPKLFLLFQKIGF